jgi:transcriptional regulator with XRE-family HTH domain
MVCSINSAIIDVLKMNFSYDELGKNIKILREKKGWTQEQMSAKLQTAGCDITQSALAKIEVGQRHVYSYEIKIIKEILSVTFDEIFI